MQNIYIQLTNEIGSTVAPPVTVQVSVTSIFGVISSQRYLELARIISGITEKNLSRGNSTFGRVREVRLSSYFKGMFHGHAPSPAPAPSPEPADPPEYSISPYRSPSPSPVPPPDPCPYSGFSHPPRSPPKSYSKPFFEYSAAPAPSLPVNPTAEISPDQAPKTETSHGSRPGLGKGKTVKPIHRSLGSLPSCKLIFPFISLAWLDPFGADDKIFLMVLTF